MGMWMGDSDDGDGDGAGDGNGVGDGVNDGEVGDCDGDGDGDGNGLTIIRARYLSESNSDSELAKYGAVPADVSPDNTFMR